MTKLKNYDEYKIPNSSFISKGPFGYNLFLLKLKIENTVVK